MNPRSDDPPVGLTALVANTGSPEPSVRNEAWRQLEPWVMQELRPYVEARARRKGALDVTITHVMQDAILGVDRYLQKLEGVNTDWFRGLFLKVAFRRLADRLRANMRLRDDPLPENEPAARDESPRLVDTFDQFLHALDALETHEIDTWRAGRERAGNPPGANDRPGLEDTPMASAVRARFLARHDLRPLVGVPVGPDQFNPRPRTFTDLGELLGIDAGTANRWFWDGVEWMKKRDPGLDAVFAPKQPSGNRPRKKGGADERR